MTQHSMTRNDDSCHPEFANGLHLRIFSKIIAYDATFNEDVENTWPDHTRFFLNKERKLFPS